MKRTRRILSSAIAALSVIASAGFAQSDKPARANPQSSVYLQIVVFDAESTGVSRVDQYIQIPYSELSFVSSDGSYLAKYELSIQIRNESGDIAWQWGQNVEIRAREFAQTVSDRLSNLRHVAADLKPGSYEYLLQVSDLESKRNATIKRSVVVRGFDQDTVSVSDVLLVNKVTTDSLRTTIVPNVMGSFGPDANRFYLYFELYTRCPVDSIRLVYRIVNRAGVECGSGFKWETISGPVTTVIMGIDSIPADAGEYRVNLDVTPSSHAVANISPVAVGRTFSVAWRELPQTIQDIDKAIEQLRYIADTDDLDALRAGKDIQERKQRLVAFWAKRDPDARTERNELMEEYYARVAYANENYTHYMEGWRTDMGMVYIRFGPPDNIERHPFETNTRPYEVWYYYQQNREFVFVDESGFGDFRLRYPNTDLWGRIR